MTIEIYNGEALPRQDLLNDGKLGMQLNIGDVSTVAVG